MNSLSLEKATFAAGCFWGVEELFRSLPGVVDTSVGYIGGTTDRPTYEDVCTDTTGHAEAVEIVFNPQQISYKELLDIFWTHHDPTQINQQGLDVGTQYRSAIFYHSLEQKQLAEHSKKQIEESHLHNKPIATQVVPATTFFPVEDYHQKYLMKRGKGTCHI